MALARLEPGTRMGDQVFDALHAAIMSGELPAGRRLRIRELATELGTSVMPVREAIRRLEEHGLAEAHPHKSAVIKSFTPTELLHVYGVRRLLEVEAATLGAHRLTPEDAEGMRGLYASIEDAVRDQQIVAYLDHDEEFLSIIYAASGNPVLLETIRTLWSRCRSYKIVGVQRELDGGEPASLLSYQERLLEAVSSGDSALAGRLTAESLDVAIRRIRQALPEVGRNS